MQFDFEFGKCFICKNECDIKSQGCDSCMREISLNETYISVCPKSYGDNDFSCGYCQVLTPFIEGHFDIGIRYCLKHKSQAQNDMRKWLIKNNCVFLKDIKLEYRELYKILENGIHIRRSSGTIDNGWKLDKVKSLIKKSNLGWSLTFCKYDIPDSDSKSPFFSNKIFKNIPILFLIDDPSYNRIFKDMLSDLENRLENGFYLIY